MKPFRELNRLGYRHYTENTIEELDDLPLNATERIMEQALVLRWFRENYQYYTSTGRTFDNNWFIDILCVGVHKQRATVFGQTYEEAELAAITKLIGIIKETRTQE